MLRFALALTFILLVGGIGYYFGRSSVEPQEQTRARVATEPTEPTESSAERPRSERETRIGLPIAGLQRSDIMDTFDQARDAGARTHEATDIMAPRGTPVLAVVTGPVRKLFQSRQGGLTIYQYDEAERYVYYYAHLDRYAADLEEGTTVRRGEVIGYVGSTGNADPAAPHLHFAISELGPDKNWWTGLRPINPYPFLIEALNQH